MKYETRYNSRNTIQYLVYSLLFLLIISVLALGTKRFIIPLWVKSNLKPYNYYLKPSVNKIYALESKYSRDMKLWNIVFADSKIPQYYDYFCRYKGKISLAMHSQRNVKLWLEWI